MHSTDPSPALPMNGLLVAACIVIVTAGLRAAANVLVPIVIAMFLAVLLAPAVRSLRRLRVPPFVGIPLVVMACVAVIALIGGVVGQSINALVASAPRYQQRFSELTHAAELWMRAHHVSLSQQNLMAVVRPDTVLALLGHTLSQVAAVVSHTLLVLLLLVFLLFDAVDLPDRMKGALGRTSVDVSRWSRIAVEVKEYLVL
ncbi:MAG: AI-2E family transporter, partial [Myxococcales bacterium]